MTINKKILFLSLALCTFLNLSALNQSELVNQAYGLLTNKISSLDDQAIGLIIRQTLNQAQANSINKSDFLKELKSKIERDVEYCKSNITAKIDYSGLMLGATLAAISLTCAGLGYYIYQKWHKASNIQFNAIIDALHEHVYKIRETTIYKNNLFAPHWGLIPETKIDISSPYRSIQGKSIAEYESQLVSLRDTAEWAFLAEFCAFGGSLFWGALSIFPIGVGLFPRHKERYEKFCLIQEKINQFLETL